MILCDTNVLIEFYKGRADVTNALRSMGISNIAISVVTAAELFYGARDKRELRKMQKHLALLRQLPLDTETSRLFLTLIETYALSHNLTIPDALIAATALRHQIPLYTFNTNDFKFITTLALYTA